MSDPAIHTHEHDELLEFSRKRRVLMWVWLTATTIFFVGALVFVNLTVARHAKRYDWTSSQAYTIHDSTRQTLATIPADASVDIYVTYLVPMTPYGEDLTMQVAYGMLKSLLEEFAQANPRIRVHIIERENDPTVNEIRREFKEGPSANMVYLVAQRGDKPVKQAFPLMALYVGDPTTGTVRTFYAESAIASAILQATDLRRGTVYYTTGHREFSPTRPDASGLTAVARVLDTWANVNLKELDFSKTDTVPEDCDVLMIPGLGTSFNVAEVSIVEKYLERGGRLFVALQTDAEAGGGLQPLLEKWGVRLLNEVVIDPSSARVGNVGLIPVRHFGQHDINRGMNNIGFLMPFCRVVESVQSDRTQAMELMYGAPGSWSQPFSRKQISKIDGDREAPPLAAAAITRIDKGRFARVVGWGSAHALTNYFVMNGSELSEERAGYVLNTFRWLLEKEGQIVAPPKKVERRPLELKNEQANVMAVITIVVMPLVGVVLGAIAWFFRRK